MADKEKLIKQAKEHLDGTACPICGNKEWNYGKDLLTLSDNGGDKIEASYAVCTNCGYTPEFTEV